jgi:hypothetical protein
MTTENRRRHGSRNGALDNEKIQQWGHLNFWKNRRWRLSAGTLKLAFVL